MSPLADGDREIPSVGQVGSFSSDRRRPLRPVHAPNVGDLLGAQGDVGGVGASRKLSRQSPSGHGQHRLRQALLCVEIRDGELEGR
jgi:hypothetical protein